MRGFAPELQVKQYVAVVRSRTGQRFRVFKTGDDKYYLFDPIDAHGCSYCNAFAIRKTDLRSDIRRALAHGMGNDMEWGTTMVFKSQDREGMRLELVTVGAGQHSAWSVATPEQREQIQQALNDALRVVLAKVKPL